MKKGGVLSVEEVTKLLNGVWVRELYKSDERVITQEKENGKALIRTYEDGKLIKVEKKDGYDAVKIKFDNMGSGDYEEFLLNFDLTSTAIEGASEQPKLKLIQAKGEYKIEFIYMMESRVQTIECLNDSVLVLVGDNGIRQKFRKVKE
ncbi:hypothetical protein I2I11_20420 [Pontibacter sp. 172403-2]|uniref:hypothetical protein n=1 Tax=Pontibacter rufus TaxID=2791028 RepID=UPI0018AFD7F6|nr:hypothetical protein [Pontibacter sp. 172403-2]MBF9255674.1 hypothetical protein [Pontibacter sp. 172403-2]